MAQQRRCAHAWKRIAVAFVVAASVIGAAAPAAEASGIGFLVVHSPNPANSEGSYLDGVTCASSAACVAVGHYVDADGADRALVETGNDAGWGIVVVHLPAGAVSSDLYKVSCSSASACMAVGKYDGTDGVDRPLAERWNGTSWTDAAALPDGSGPSSLNSVSCRSATVCMAVGYGTSSPSGDALTERWDGSSWTLVPAAAPAGQSPVLQAVSCVLATCLAVGEYAGASGELSLGERWNGVRWKVSKTRNRAGESNYLYGITCVSSTSCFAVGSHSASIGTAKPLVEEYSANGWATSPAPSPGGSTYSDLDGIACSSGTSCLAVGSQVHPDSNGKAFAEDWMGTAWTLDKPLYPHKSTGDYLTGAYCSTEGTCTFAGGYSTNTSVDRTLIETAQL